MLSKQFFKYSLTAALLMGGLKAGAQVAYTSKPLDYRLYPRDAQDSASVAVAGTVSTAGVDSVILEILKGATTTKRVAMQLAYSAGSAPFSLSAKIHAELSEHTVRFYTKTGATQTQITQWTNVVSGDVYVLDGQSNTEACYCYSGGYALPTPVEWVRSFGNASQTPASVTGNLSWGVAVNSGSQANYTVGVWGYQLGAKIVQRQQVPVCIVNGAIGGTTVAQHLKNTSNPTDLNTIYGRLLYRLQQAGLTNSVKALLWYQGESDYGNAPATYLSTFTTVYNAWMSDYPSISKVYVVQTHHGCTAGAAYSSDIREVHRTLPNTFSNIVTMSSNNLPGHDGCHYQTQGYDSLASRMFRLVARDFYGSGDTVEVGAPNLVKAYYTSGAKTQIKLVFRNVSNMQITSVGSYNIKDYFYLSDGQTVSSVTTSGNTVTLNLAAPSTASTLSYTPNDYYNGTSTTFQGPYLVNGRSIGALCFKGASIMNSNDATPDEVPQPSISNGTASIGGTTVFTGSATPTPASWTWTFTPAVSFTNGTNANSQNPQVIFPAAGTYTVQLIATNSLGSGVATSSITLYAPPVADFNVSNGYTDVPVNFTDNSANTPTSRSWTFPAGTSFASGSSSTVVNPLVYFPTAGTYNVTLYTANSAGNNSITKSVTITERRPSANFTASNLNPTLGSNVTFTNSSSNGPVTYAWTVPANCSFIGGTSYTSQNIQLSFPRRGSYKVSLSAANSYGITAVKTVTVVVQ